MYTCTCVYIYVQFHLQVYAVYIYICICMVYSLSIHILNCSSKRFHMCQDKQERTLNLIMRGTAGCRNGLRVLGLSLSLGQELGPTETSLIPQVPSNPQTRTELGLAKGYPELLWALVWLGVYGWG